MKVLVIVNNMGYDGISTVVFNYVKNIGREIDINVIVAGKCENILRKELQENNVRVYVLPNRKKNTLKYLYKLYKKCKTEKYNIVHINGNGSSMAIDLYVCKLANIPIRISHTHSASCNSVILNSLLRPLLFRVATNRFACSNKAGKWLYKNKSFDIIKNAIDLDKYRFDDNKRKHYRELLDVGDNYLIGHVGYFEEVKNHEFIIKIFEKLKQKNNAVKLILIGNGSLKNKIIKIVEQKKLINDVIFINATDKIADLYQAFDVLLFPSKNESFGMVAIEAQKAGIPVLASTEIPEEVNCCEYFRYESLNNSEDIWADDLLELLKKYNDRSNKKIYVKLEEYDIKKQKNNMVRIYTELLKNNNGGW